MFKSTCANAALRRPACSGESTPAKFFGKFILLVFAAAASAAAAADRIGAVRVWPAQDYTRITIEADRPIRHELLLVKHPERLVEWAVRGMLPKTRLGDRLFTKLKVYAGPDHPHEAQCPRPLNVAE